MSCLRLLPSALPSLAHPQVEKNSHLTDSYNIFANRLKGPPSPPILSVTGAHVVDGVIFRDSEETTGCQMVTNLQRTRLMYGVLL